MANDFRNQIVDKSMAPIRFVGAIPSKYRQRLREKAIDNAKTRIALAGNQASNMSQQDLEIIVKEEEDKIHSSVKEKGLLAVLAFFGISLFG